MSSLLWASLGAPSGAALDEACFLQVALRSPAAPNSSGPGRGLLELSRTHRSGGSSANLPFHRLQAATPASGEEYDPAVFSKVGSSVNGSVGGAANLSQCLYDVKEGGISLIQRRGSMAYGMDLTDALGPTGVATIMVTAMNTQGTYLDQQGFSERLAEPREDMPTTLFELRLSGDGQSVGVHKPPLDVRTTDQQSSAAVERGLGDGWFSSLSRIDTPLCTGEQGLPATASGPGRVIVDMSYLIASGFFVASAAGMGMDYKVRRAEAYARNFDFTVEYLMGDTFPSSPWTVGFSVVLLPAVPMTSRPSDDRLLYFTTDFKDIGFRQAGPEQLPSRAVDRTTTMIWRYNLDRLPGHRIRIHVDPTVPARWRGWFREGIEAWNDAFELAGHPRAVQAVLPGSADWPEDYDIADARYSTVSWTLNSQVVSMGIAKVDPRSGEIVKADILMSDGWVQSWLEDLDILAPNVTHPLGSGGGRHAAKSLLERTVSAAKTSEHGGHHHAGHKNSPGNGHNAASFSLLSAAFGRVLNNSEQEDLVGAGLRDVVMHEVGHILGLRHNFKGSLGVSSRCIKDKSCSSVHGLTASVMDYIPMNMPTADGPEVHAFTPVVGAYDKLAIQYGYMDTEGMPPHRAEAKLQEVLREAEAYSVCYDADEGGEDPSCQAYDFTSDPLQYLEDELDLYAVAQRLLLNMSVAPGESYGFYGPAVHFIMSKSLNVGLTAVKWIGGINNTYSHRGVAGGQLGPVAKWPMPVGQQRRALDLVLRILRPEQAGLLPPAKNLPYLVSGAGSGGQVASYDLSSYARSLTQNLVGSLLEAPRLLQLHHQENLLAEEGVPVLGVDEFLGALTNSILGLGLNTLRQPEEELQAAFVRGLASLHHGQLPDRVASQVLYHLRRVQEAVEAASEQAAAAVEGRGWCAGESEECACSNGTLDYGTSGAWSAAVMTSNAFACNGRSPPRGPIPGLTKLCKCLLGRPRGAGLFRAHAQLLQRELSAVFCDPSAPCEYPRVPAVTLVRAGAKSSQVSPAVRLVAGAVFLAGSWLVQA